MADQLNLPANTFRIQPYKVLDKSLELFTVDYNIQGFADEFSVNYSLRELSDVNNNGPMGLRAGFVTGTVALKKSDLSELDDSTIVKTVVDKFNLILVK